MSQRISAIGVMSGTSLDGLDIAYCSFSKNGVKWSYVIYAARCVDYGPDWRKRLAEAHNLSGEELALLDADLGRFIANQVNLLLMDKGLPRPDIIASHGHTVFHAPYRGYTVQIGSGAHIASGTGITTVNDFRAMDVALGGQGAPLVPVGDALLFDRYTACLNLGGFSNISFDSDGVRKAFDICPVNIIMNPMAEKLGGPFDRDGAWAASGIILPKFLERLNALPVYKLDKRPSLSREWLEAAVLTLIPAEADTRDILRTISEHAAQQMAAVLNRLGGAGEVLLTGGGSYNRFLIQQLRELTPMTVTVADNLLVDFKEALIFALLGVLRMHGETNVLRSVTGARCDSSSGALHIVPY